MLSCEIRTVKRALNLSGALEISRGNTMATTPLDILLNPVQDVRVGENVLHSNSMVLCCNLGKEDSTSISFFKGLLQYFETFFAQLV